MVGIRNLVHESQEKNSWDKYKHIFEERYAGLALLSITAEPLRCSGDHHYTVNQTTYLRVTYLMFFPILKNLWIDFYELISSHDVAHWEC